jgi:hypothetical protein
VAKKRAPKKRKKKLLENQVTAFRLTCRSLAWPLALCLARSRGL